MFNFMKIFNFFQNSSFKKIFFKLLYNGISPNLDKKLGIRYMNYGYLDIFDKDATPSIEKVGMALYCLFLKEHAIEKILNEGGKVLEIGSGLGGGLSHLARLYPKTIFNGIDLSIKNIKISNNNAKKIDNIFFKKGDAENIPFKDEVYDLVINVESSHCYTNLEKFFQEVSRVLKNDCYFFYTDFTPAAKGNPKTYIANLKENIIDAGFKIEYYKDITKEILNSLDKTQIFKENLLKNMGLDIKKYFEFSAMVGSEAYNYFKNGDSIYFCMLIKKC